MKLKNLSTYLFIWLTPCLSIAQADGLPDESTIHDAAISSIKNNFVQEQCYSQKQAQTYLGSVWSSLNEDNFPKQYYLYFQGTYSTGNNPTFNSNNYLNILDSLDSLDSKGGCTNKPSPYDCMSIWNAVVANTFVIDLQEQINELNQQLFSNKSPLLIGIPDANSANACLYAAADFISAEAGKNFKPVVGFSPLTDLESKVSDSNKSFDKACKDPTSGPKNPISGHGPSGTPGPCATQPPILNTLSPPMTIHSVCT